MIPSFTSENANTRVARRDRDVGRRDESRAAAERVALHARDHRRRTAVDRLEHPPQRVRIGDVLLVRETGGRAHPVDVRAGAEARPLAGENDRPRAADVDECLRELGDQLRVECVAPVRPRERDAQDRAVPLDGQCCHERSLCPPRADRLERGEPRAMVPASSSPARGRDEHDGERHDREVAQQQEPRPRRRVVQRERPVVAREPQLRQEQRAAEQRDAAKPRRPRTSGTSGTSQIRNCGENTLPNATNTTTAAAHATSIESPLGSGRTANAIQIAEQRRDLNARRRGADRVRQRPGEILRSVRRHRRQRQAADVVRRHQQRRAETLDLQRPAELLREAVPDAARSEEGERDDAERHGGHERQHADERARARRAGATRTRARSARARAATASPPRRGRAAAPPRPGRPRRSAASAASVSITGQRSKRVSNSVPSTSGETATSPSASTPCATSASTESRMTAAAIRQPTPQTNMRTANDVA